MNLFSHDFARFVNTMNFLIPRRDIYPWSSNKVRARRTDSPGRNLHSGSFEKAAVDGIAYVYVAIAFAVSSHVTHGCESRPKGGLRVPYGHKCPGFLCRVHACPGTQAAVNMRMRVDQAGQDCGLTEVNDSSSRWNLNAVSRANFSNFVAVDQHHLIGEHLPGLAIKQVAGTDGDRWRSLCPKRLHSSHYDKE